MAGLPAQVPKCCGSLPIMLAVPPITESWMQCLLTAFYTGFTFGHWMLTFCGQCLCKNTPEEHRSFDSVATHAYLSMEVGALLVPRLVLWPTHTTHTLKMVSILVRAG